MTEPTPAPLTRLKQFRKRLFEIDAESPADIAPVISFTFVHLELDAIEAEVDATLAAKEAEIIEIGNARLKRVLAYEAECEDWRQRLEVERTLRQVAQAELAAKDAQLAELTREHEQSLAVKRGMRDFLSGQPKDIPLDVAAGAREAKESALGFAWSVGYSIAAESDLLREFIGRADRSANRAEAAESTLAEVRRRVEAIQAKWRERCRELVFAWAGAPSGKEPLGPTEIQDTFKCLQAAADYLENFANRGEAPAVAVPSPAQTPYIDRVIRRVAELPDRTSPDDWPAAMLVTADELRVVLSTEGVKNPQEFYRAGAPIAVPAQQCDLWKYGCRCVDGKHGAVPAAREGELDALLKEADQWVEDSGHWVKGDQHRCASHLILDLVTALRRSGPAAREGEKDLMHWIAHDPFCAVMGAEDSRHGWRTGDEEVCNCGLKEWLADRAASGPAAPPTPESGKK